MPVDLRERAELPRCPVAQGFEEDRGLVGALRAYAERAPDACPITLLDRHRNEQRITLGALWGNARVVRRALGDRGLRRGDLVAVILPTGFELVASYFGAMLGGGIPGLIAPPSNRFADENLYVAHLGSIIERSGTRFVITEPAVATLLRAVPAVSAAGCQVVTPEDVSTAAGEHSIFEPSPDEVVAVQYSSGSTGLPKGILLDGRAIVRNIRSTANHVGFGPADVSVNWAPLYHDMGLIDCLLMPLLGGAPVVLIPTMDFLRDPALWLWAMHRYRGTFSFAPNFAFALCTSRISDRALDGLDLSAWRVAINASEPVLPEVVDAFCDRFAKYGFARATMKPAWGLAESVCLLTSIDQYESCPRVEVDREALAKEDRAELVEADGVPLMSVGTLFDCCEIEVRDGAGTALPERRVGTVWVRTNCLFQGYHRDPERTASIQRDGWLNTGDRGFMYRGHLYFVSREKDLIVIGGEKYVPHDIETAVNRVEGVRAGCAVAFGVLNRTRGTEDLGIVAETRLTDEAEKAALGEAIRNEVTRYTGLGARYVLLVPPGGVNKTTSGKLARSATAERYHEHWA